MKLTPINLNPTVPISITLVSLVNTLSICDGMSSKHSVPTAMSTTPYISDVDSVVLHLLIFPAA